MALGWADRPERGNIWAMKLMTRLSLLLGRAFGRMFIYPVTFYFLISSPQERRNSRDFLQRVLGRKVTLRDIFRNYCYFGATLLDRVFLLSGRHQDFKVKVHGEEIIRSMQASGRGCLLLGAHLGSFELASCSAMREGVAVNSLMYVDNAKKINGILHDLNPDRKNVKIIPIGAFDALLQVKECIEQGEMLAILGDRVVNSDKLVRVPFFGQEATFPAGPFLLANALKIPVVMFFGLYLGGNEYAEHYELFAHEITLDPRQRQVDIEKWACLYAARLEHYCRQAPYNWFNFFDFWETSAVVTTPTVAASNAV